MKYGIAGIIIVGVIAGGLFYYQYSDKKQHEGNIRTIVSIREELKKTTERLDAEQARLDDLEYKKSGERRNGDVRKSYEQAKGIVSGKTDIFFNDAHGAHPELNIKIKDDATKKFIDQKRAEINEALTVWASHIDTATSVELRANLILESNRNLGIIAAYIDSLGEVVASLTPQNSGLSQTQISTYTNTVAQASTAIEDVTVPTVIVTPATPSGQASTTVTTNVGIVANTSSEGGSSNPTGPTAVQIEAELEVQRTLVAQVAAAAATLAAELAQAEAAVAAAAATAQAQANTQNQSGSQNQNSNQPASSPTPSEPPVPTPGDPVPTEHVTIPEQYYPDQPQLIQGW